LKSRLKRNDFYPAAINMRRSRRNMAKSIKREPEDFLKSLKLYGEKTFYNLSFALLIWLFAVLVFIPIAGSINRETEFLCNLIFFMIFTFLIARSLWGLKKMVDSFSMLLAKKYGLKRGWRVENLAVVFRRSSYMVLMAIFYLLYHPFLTRFHPSINGMVFILVLLSIFFLLIGVFSILFSRMLEWLSSVDDGVDSAGEKGKTS